MIPCKLNKCILLPVCKNKINIICTPLNDWYDHHMMSTDDIDTRNIWKRITDHLPNIVRLKAEGDNFDYFNPL